MEEEYHKGRGAQIKTSNPFLKQEYVAEHIEGIDEEMIGEKVPTQILYENPKKVVNKVDSPDVRMYYSLNPYQGCEHGCIYCYARKTHEYWGYNAGLDFETKIIVKRNAPELLEKHLLQGHGSPSPSCFPATPIVTSPLKESLVLPAGFLRYSLNTVIRWALLPRM